MVQGRFWVSGTNEDLVGKQKNHIRSDTLTIEGRVAGNGLVTDPLPSIKFTGISTPDGKDMMAQVWIAPIAATVSLNEAIGGFDVLIRLLDTHTSQREVGEIIYWDIQFVQASPKIVQTWKGSLLIEADRNLVQ